MSRIINDLKKLHGCIMDEHDNFLPKMKSFCGEKGLEARRIELIKGLMYLVMNTKITSTNTKNYIRSHDSSVKRFVESYNLIVKEDEQLKSTSVSQSVDYDRKKLLEFFPNSVISDVIIIRDINMADYEKMLNIASAKYANNRKLLNSLALIIPKTAVNDNLSEEGFYDLLGTIAPYTKIQMKYISENLPIEQVGYLNYLVSAHNLENEDLERFKILKSLLEGEGVEDPGETEHTEQDEDMDLVEDKYTVEYENIDPDENETTIENKEQIKGRIRVRETVTLKKGGIKSSRIQYDVTKLGDDNEHDIDLEYVDFGDIDYADVE